MALPRVGELQVASDGTHAGVTNHLEGVRRVKCKLGLI